MKSSKHTNNEYGLIQQFAAKHNLKAKRSPVDQGVAIIPGKIGQSHLYEHSDAELGVCFIPTNHPTDPVKARNWGNARRECLAAGMTLRLNCEDEGLLTFDPNNRQQAKLAIKIIGARPKRRLSPEQIARQVATLAKFRESAKQEDHLAV